MADPTIASDIELLMETQSRTRNGHLPKLTDQTSWSLGDTPSGVEPESFMSSVPEDMKYVQLEARTVHIEAFAFANHSAEKSTGSERGRARPTLAIAEV